MPRFDKYSVRPGEKRRERFTLGPDKMYYAIDDSPEHSRARLAYAQALMKSINEVGLTRHTPPPDPVQMKQFAGLQFRGVSYFNAWIARCILENPELYPDLVAKAREVLDWQTEADTWKEIDERLGALAEVCRDNLMALQGDACVSALDLIHDVEQGFTASGSDPASPDYKRLLGISSARVLYAALRPHLAKARTRVQKRVSAAMRRYDQISDNRYFQRLLNKNRRQQESP